MGGGPLFFFFLFKRAIFELELLRRYNEVELNDIQTEQCGRGECSTIINATNVFYWAGKILRIVESSYIFHFSRR